MTRYGYFLSCEEYPPADLVRQARLAEQAGFVGLWISDHFHPWLDEQGEAAFAWTVIGAIAQATSLPITGGPWPSAEDRLDMLAEAVELIRELLSGKPVTHHGRHYTVDTARLYSVPESPPPIYVSGFGGKSVQLAARIGDGYMSVMPSADMVRMYRESGGGDRPVQG